jgi:hypothetical protein
VGVFQPKKERITFQYIPTFVKQTDLSLLAIGWLGELEVVSKAKAKIPFANTVLAVYINNLIKM